MEQTPLGILLSCSARAARQYMDRRVKDYGITPTQCRAMLILHENRDQAFSQKDLERALSLRGSTVNGIVDRLEEKGLVIRRPSPLDGRRNNLALTGAGEEMRLRFWESLQTAEADLSRGFSTEELERFRAYLLRVIRGLETGEE